MAGYFIYSMNWEKFDSFVTSPDRKTLLQIADMLVENVGELPFEEPVLGACPQDREELADVLAERFQRDDWYRDLDEDEQESWCEFIGFQLTELTPFTFQAEMEIDSVYWDVISIGRAYHNVPVDRVTDQPISKFGMEPFRCTLPSDYRRGGGFTPMFTMHPPNQLREIIDQLKAAEPEILSNEEAAEDYGHLMPALQNILDSNRMLLVQVDT